MNHSPRSFYCLGLFWVVLLLVLVFVQSPTIDEPAHLMAGLIYWTTGEFDFYRVNPPLVRLVCALPATAMLPPVPNVAMPSGIRLEWSIAANFANAIGPDYMYSLWAARMVSILFTVAGAVVIHAWAKSLFGSPSACFAAALWAGSPCVLGHGTLLTCDVPAATMSLLAAYVFHSRRHHDRWTDRLAVGAISGVAILVKFSCLITVLSCFVVDAVQRYREMRTITCSRLHCGVAVLRRLLVLMGILWLVINCGYGWEGTGTCLGEFRFISSQFHNVQASVGQSWASMVPVLLPSNFVLGIDTQQRDFEAPFRQYFRGEWRDHGCWYWYGYVACLKTPLGYLALVAVGVILRLVTFRTTRFPGGSEAFIVFPGVAVLCVLSLKSGFTDHYRYLLPAFPFLFVWVSRFVAADMRLAVRRTCWGMLALGIVSVGFQFPNCLAYFHEIAGGASGGSWHVLNSNLDWGQDVGRLKAWQDAHPESKPMCVECFSPLSMTFFGIASNCGSDDSIAQALSRQEPPAGQSQLQRLRPGWYALSRQSLMASEWWTPFRRMQPIHQVGATILIYQVSRDSYEADNR